MVMLLEQRGANLSMQDYGCGEHYSALQLATNLNQNEIVAYLEQVQKPELKSKWKIVFQDKPILMSELESHIEDKDDVSNTRVHSKHLLMYLVAITLEFMTKI